VKIDFKSERSQRQIGYLALIGGLTAGAGGIFGVWMQGRTMYSGDSLVNIADALCPQDIYLSVCLASLAILIGGFSLSWVILASKLTEKFSAARRNICFVVFTIVFLMAIIIASKIATDQDWAKATAAEADYFSHMKTNAPAKK
jgi:hypothetical protein